MAFKAGDRIVIRGSLKSGDMKVYCHGFHAIVRKAITHSKQLKVELDNGLDGYADESDCQPETTPVTDFNGRCMK